MVLVLRNNPGPSLALHPTSTHLALVCQSLGRAGLRDLVPRTILQGREGGASSPSVVALPVPGGKDRLCGQLTATCLARKRVKGSRAEKD